VQYEEFPELVPKRRKAAAAGSHDSQVHVLIASAVTPERPIPY